jgi:hypothetical protein
VCVLPEFFEKTTTSFSYGRELCLTSDDRPALRTDTAHVDTVHQRSWTNQEEVDPSSTALADERRLHESARDSRRVDRYRSSDLRARNRARERGWHRIPWTGCLLVPKAARSQDRSQSQVVQLATCFLGVLATVTRVRPRGQRVDDHLETGRESYSSGSMGVTVSSDWRRSTSSSSASAVRSRSPLTSWPHVNVCTSRLSGC